MKRRARSYENVGRKKLHFDDKGRDGKWREARDVLRSKPMVPPTAFYAAAKLKAHEANHKDAKKVLNELSKDPVENGAKIVQAMEAAEKEGKIGFDLFECKVITTCEKAAPSETKFTQANPS